MPPTARTVPMPARVAYCVLGLVLFGLAIALTVAADLGLGAWDVLHQGLAERIGLPIGTAAILVGLAVLLLWIPLRQRPGLGTLLNAVLVGLFLDLWLLVLPDDLPVPARGAELVAGIALFGVASGCYLGAGLGAGPRDGLMTGLAARGWPVARARTMVEVLTLGVGWLLGGSVGVGTIAITFGLGPSVALWYDRLRLPGVPTPHGRHRTDQ
ncbi:MAG: YczE/YyaS/YitT family protein [Acidimicrobiales bacterium]